MSLILHLERLSCRLAFELWNELDAGPWAAPTGRWAMDPEPLIAFTCAIDLPDPPPPPPDLERLPPWEMPPAVFAAFRAFTPAATRAAPLFLLHDAMTEWCLRFADCLSTHRLKTCLTWAGPLAAERYRRLASRVRRVAMHQYEDGEWTARPSAEPPFAACLDLAPPALLSLRFRVLFGRGAKAELMRALFVRGTDGATLATLVADTGSGRANLYPALKALIATGLVEFTPVPNGKIYRLADRAGLTPLLGALPAAYPPWLRYFRIAQTLKNIARRAADLPPAERRALAWAENRKIRAIRLNSGLPGLSTGGDIDDFWPAFTAYTENFLRLYLPA